MTLLSASFICKNYQRPPRIFVCKSHISFHYIKSILLSNINLYLILSVTTTSLFTTIFSDGNNKFISSRRKYFSRSQILTNDKSRNLIMVYFMHCIFLNIRLGDRKLIIIWYQEDMNVRF
jgi:hypothetical protein